MNTPEDIMTATAADHYDIALPDSFDRFDLADDYDEAEAAAREWAIDNASRYGAPAHSTSVDVDLGRGVVRLYFDEEEEYDPDLDVSEAGELGLDETD